MRLFNTAEAAELLGIGVGRVKQLVADGRLVPSRRNPYIFTIEALIDLQTRWEPGKSGRPSKSPLVDVIIPQPQVPVS